MTIRDVLASVRAIEDLDADPDARAALFPVTTERAFLAHAAVAPLPAVVREATDGYLARAERDDQEAVFASSMEAELREWGAGLLGMTGAEEIALVGPTTLALAMVAEGLDLRVGDNLVYDPADFPSNVYPWIRLRERGIETRPIGVVPDRPLGPDDVASVIDERTRLVSLASVHFLTGRRIDLAGIGRLLRDRGIWFNVDAIQGVGAVRTEGAWADSIAADAHKWLLGPQGVGLFGVRRAVQDRLRPVAVGWRNVHCPDFLADDEIRYRDGAIRFEGGSPCFAGLAGMHAALGMLTHFGIEAIEQRVTERTILLAAELRDLGCELAADPTPATAAGIVSFRPPDGDIAGLRQRLVRERISVSVRGSDDVGRWIRISPHFYNPDEDLARLLEIVRA